MYVGDKQNILSALTLALVSKANYRRENENSLVLYKREMNVDSLIFLLSPEIASIDSVKSHLDKIINTYADSLQTSRSFFYFLFLGKQEEISEYKEALKDKFKEGLKKGILCDLILVDIGTLEYMTLSGSKIIDKKVRDILEKDLKQIDENLDEYKKIQEELTDVRKIKALNPGSILIIINVIIFFIGRYIYIRQGYDFFLIIGIQNNDLIFQGQAWRLITSMFLHADLTHLLGNMISLFYLSSILLPHMKDRDFIFLYSLSGLVASLSSLFFTKGNSLGASGAIMGLGAYMIYSMFLSKRGFLFRRRGNFLVFAYMILFNLLHGLFTPNIDNYGHFGGFFAGLLIAYWFAKRKVRLYE